MSDYHVPETLIEARRNYWKCLEGLLVEGSGEELFTEITELETMLACLQYPPFGE